MEQEGATIHDNYIYHSQNLRIPEIGDIRIKYDVAGMSGLTGPNYVRNLRCSIISYGGDLYSLNSSFPVGQYNSSPIYGRPTDNLL